ncbi:hypothetical protein DENSPDRAFT_666810 [Dentipellis sp. KUC8613]|nr:hypothetical protein DENSPDRAFT_666810 [Dentipellis sp. KUC8613]
MPSPMNSLVHLEIAFLTDGLDRGLFNHIVTAFPNLQFLQIHRYRPQSEDDVDIDSFVADLAQDLSALPALQHFRMYLDHPNDKPRSKVNYRERHSAGAVDNPNFLALLHHYATIIAHDCSSALEIIDFLTNKWFGTQVWKRWYVSRDHGGRPVVRFENDPSTRYVYSERFDDRP